MVSSTEQVSVLACSLSDRLGKGLKGLSGDCISEAFHHRFSVGVVGVIFCMRKGSR